MSAKAKKKAQKKAQNNSAPKTEDQIDQEFLEAYRKLCDEHKRGLTASPAWRYSEDGNDFRLQLQLSVNRMVD